MRRLLGVVPVVVLGLAIAVSAVIGLSLSSDASQPSLADELGCAHVSSSHPQPGVSQETCRFHGDTILILTLDKGAHRLDGPDVLDNVVLTPEGRPMVVECETRDDCVAVHRQVGGDLSSGPMLGVSLVIG